jgi:DNA polymerase epsilon subunit 2
MLAAFLEGCEQPQQKVESLVEMTKCHLKTKQGVVDAMIDADVIQAVIEVDASRLGTAVGAQGPSSQLEDNGLGDGIEVYNLLKDVRPFQYSRTSKEWLPVLEGCQLFPGADQKAKIMRDRYQVLWQRLFLEGRFVAAADAPESTLVDEVEVLTPVESLMGNPGRKTTFGLLTRVTMDGPPHWELEDLHRSVKLQLRQTWSSDLITDGSFVLAEGEMVEDVFAVDRLRVPPAVSEEISRFRDRVPCQIFGGNLTEQKAQLLRQAEDEAPGADDMYVILSEVHLDSARVLDKLGQMLQVYETNEPPAVYVLMGSFCSVAFVPTADGLRTYREGFERLKLLLSHLPRHAERGTRFVLLPGPMDPGSQLLPRAPLPAHLTAGIAREVPGVVMGSNPCRIRHFSQELVFFRHDVLRLLRRHEAVPLRGPDGHSPSPQHIRDQMVRLLLDQAHLVPLPLEESNAHWSLDHTLHLYPLPSAIFLGGSSQGFAWTAEGCNFVSVGAFPRDASFYAYTPISRTVQDSSVPDGAA